MKLPVIFLIDDDPQVLRSITRDIRSKFRKDYRVLATESVAEALTSLRELKLQGEEVALFISDQRMPEMMGVEFLAEAMKIFPKARRALLTAYSDTDAAIRAINNVSLDYYLLKPWDPPEEKLYPVVEDLLDDWHAKVAPAFSGTRILGYQWSPASHKIKDFLNGNLVPYRFLDVTQNEEAKELLSLTPLQPADFPALVLETGEIIPNPDLKLVAEKVGLHSEALATTYDVIIIGAGPAGLAAGVYGGSEGLHTLLLERKAPGGQAGTSSRIENYLGFPAGLSGAELTRRAVTQATRFGVEFLSPAEVREIRYQEPYKIIALSDGSELFARSVVITTGVEYRMHDAVNAEQFSGAGVYYGAATTEAAACTNEDVYIVGGGNSAGQAAMYLSQFARRVFIVIRKPDLSSSMSQYLIDQIGATENIEVVAEMVVKEVHGGERLESLVLESVITGKCHQVSARALFVFIGAKPCTDWLGSEFLRNDKGFIETGRSLLGAEGFQRLWKKDREPFLLETSVPGVFAAGDVRAGAMNRVASAVGEGAMAIKFVHEFLAEI